MISARGTVLVLKREHYDAEEIDYYRKKGFRVKKVKFDTNKMSGSTVDSLDTFVMNRPTLPLELELEYIEQGEEEEHTA